MWYEEEAKTTLDHIHRDSRWMTACNCANCVAVREELPAAKIERKLRGIILALSGMSSEEQDCVRVHLQELRKASPDETLKDDSLNGMLGSLERFIWKGLHADR